jgi:signal transduction histidine kinase
MGYVSICFSDNGYGISAAGMKKLFREENSLQEHKEINKQGTGFGLKNC